MKEFILGVDIGNTNSVFGLFEKDADGEILHDWRTVTRRERTSDELGIFLLGFLHSSGIDPAAIKGFIYSSVVPPFNPIVERMARDYFNCDPLNVRWDSVPLKIEYPHPPEIGADRLVNAAAAREMYGGDLIIIDMGTATTFCVMHEEVYLGGSIAPGLKMSIESLSRKTAQLPPIEFARPAGGVVGDSTIHAMQSGFFYGWVGLLRGISEEIKRSGPDRKYRSVATGGLCTLIQREVPDLFDIVEPDLTLKGLQVIYRHMSSAG